MIGRHYQVGLAKEATRGTKAVPTFWVPLLDMPTIENKQEYENNEQGIGVIADTDGSEMTRIYAEGEINGKIRDKSFGLILLSAFGSLSSALKGGESTVYNHSFSLLNTNTHPSLTMEVKNSNQQLAYVRAMLSSLKINAEVGKFIEYTAGFMAMKGVAGTATPAYDTAESEFTSNHIALKLASDLTGLDAASDVDVQSVELSIEKNPELIWKFKSNEPADIQNTVFAIEGNIEAVFDSTTLKAIHEGNTARALRLSLANTGVTIGTASNPGLVIDLAKVKFHGWDKSGGMNETVKQSINFKAHYSMGDAKIATAILTNTNASY